MARRAELTVRRPRSVTVVTVIAMTAAVVALCMAVALVMATLVPRGPAERIDPVPLFGVAAWCLVGGLGQLVGGVLSFRGSRTGRILLCAVFALHVLLNGVVATVVSEHATVLVFVVIVTVPLVGLLWMPRANEYFTGRLRSSGGD